jgi:aldose 1-epimerase
MRDQLRLTGPDGLTLTVRSNSPGIQFYDAAGFDGSMRSPSGVPYPQHAGLAVEPQHYPDSPNQPNFPSTILRPGSEYSNRIQWLIER